MRRGAVPAELAELLEAGRKLVTSHESSLVRKRARRALRLAAAALLKRYPIPGAKPRHTFAPCPFCKTPLRLTGLVTYTYPKGGKIWATPAWWHLTEHEGVNASQLQSVSRWAYLHRQGSFRTMVIAAGMAADLGKKGASA